MRKLTAFILCIVMILSLSACGAGSTGTLNSHSKDTPVDITEDNLYDYFEEYRFFGVGHDTFDETVVVGCFPHVFLKIKDEYADSIDPYESELVVEVHSTYVAREVTIDFDSESINYGNTVEGYEPSEYTEVNDGGYIIPDTFNFDSEFGEQFFGASVGYVFVNNDYNSIHIPNASPSHGVSVENYNQADGNFSAYVLDDYEITKVKGQLIFK